MDPERRDRFEARVLGMHCAGCVTSIEKAVSGVDGVESAEVNLGTSGLSARLARGRSSDETLVAEIAGAVESAGPYRLDPGERPASCRSSPGVPGRDHGAIRRAGSLATGVWAVGAALLLAFAAMAVAMSGTGGSGLGRMLQFLLATPVLAVFGGRYLSALWSALRRRVFGMDSLIGLGAGTAFAASLAQLLAGGGPLFFDTAALIVAIVALGRALEERARGRAANALAELLALAPERARVLRDGHEAQVGVEEVAVGERIEVRPGERVPLDGRIVRGGAAMDESLVSGESVPVERTGSDPVLAGALNLTGVVEVEVTRAAAASTLARIAASVERAQAGKIPIQRAADRVAGVFVPAVMAVAAVTLGAWLLAGGGVPFALARGVAVLVVSCPCAIGLAAPIAVLAATGKSARLGILFRSGAALEALAAVRAVGLDKTGTVTEGKPEVVSVAPAAGRSARELIEAAAAAERGSEHPLAVALVAHARREGVVPERPDRFEALPGRGVAATLAGGGRVFVGSERLVRERGIEPGAHPGRTGASGRLQVVLDEAWLGSVGFRDRPRPEAAELVRRLAADALPVALLSGDEPDAVAAVAAEIGIRRSAGGLLPDQKLAAIDRLRAEHGPVAMVGDGINDAPALARADVGIAFAEGADVAREAAAVTLVRADLRLVSVAVRLARRSVRIIRQNLFWAFAYNIAAIPIAAGVLYPSTGILPSPEAAAAAMALSSLAVVGNALRLGRSAPLDPPRDRPEAPSPTPR